jgi:hypothetical protein
MWVHNLLLPSPLSLDLSLPPLVATPRVLVAPEGGKGDVSLMATGGCRAAKLRVRIKVWGLEFQGL